MKEDSVVKIEEYRNSGPACTRTKNIPPRPTNSQICPVAKEAFQKYVVIACNYRAKRIDRDTARAVSQRTILGYWEEKAPPAKAGLASIYSLSGSIKGKDAQ